MRSVEIVEPRHMLSEPELEAVRSAVRAELDLGGTAPQTRRRILDRCCAAVSGHSYMWVYSSWYEGEDYPRNIAYMTSANASFVHGRAIARRQYRIGRKRPYPEMLEARRLVMSRRSHTVLEMDMWPTWHDPHDLDAQEYARAAGSRDFITTAWPIELRGQEVFFVGAKFGSGPDGISFTRQHAAIVDAFMFYGRESMMACLPSSFLEFRKLSRTLAVYVACWMFSGTPSRKKRHPLHSDVARWMGTSEQRSIRNLTRAFKGLSVADRKALWRTCQREVWGNDENQENGSERD